MLYRPRDYYEKMGVTPLLGCTATEIDPAKQIVRLADGRDVPYDKLLVATGSRPFVPPMAGLDQVEKKFSFLTLDDARALAAAADPAQPRADRGARGSSAQSAPRASATCAGV